MATELAEANGAVQIVGHVRTLGGAEAALRALRPSVLVLDPELAHRDGLCAIRAAARVAGTAIVLPLAGEPRPRSFPPFGWQLTSSSAAATATA